MLHKKRGGGTSALQIIQTTAGGDACQSVHQQVLPCTPSPRHASSAATRSQTNRLSIKVVISTKLRCDATQRCLLLLQPSQPAEVGREGGEGGRWGWCGVRRGGDETFRREGDGALRYLVDVPFLTSQMLHLKASAVFLKVHTLQSQ